MGLQTPIDHNKDLPKIKPRGLLVAETDLDKSGAAPVMADRPHRTMSTDLPPHQRCFIPTPNPQLGGPPMRKEPELVRDKYIQIPLDKYKGVFPSELTAVLLPDRGTGHTIWLEAIAVLLWRRNRRMSPAEYELCEKYPAELHSEGL